MFYIPVERKPNVIYLPKNFTVSFRMGMFAKMVNVFKKVLIYNIFRPSSIR